MHIRFNHDRFQRCPRMPEPDPLFADFKASADLAVNVEKSGEFFLLSSLNKNIALGSQRSTRPARGLISIRNRTMGVASKPLNSLDENNPIRFHRNNGTHFLQDGNEVDNF